MHPTPYIYFICPQKYFLHEKIYYAIVLIGDLFQKGINGMKRTQKGSTMIEMLGVLAIGAIISLVGLAAFLMAMNRYRTHQILDYRNRCAIVALTNHDGYVVEDTYCGKMLSDDAPNGLNGMEFVVVGATGNQTKYTITTPVIESDDIRTALLSRATTDLNGELIDVWDFQRKVEFTFRKN